MSRLPRPPNKKKKQKKEKEKKNTHTAGCMRSRLLTCFEEKVAGFLVYCTYFLSRRSDTRNIISNQQSYLCRVSALTILFFWYVGFSFYHEWNLKSRSACGTWTSFWKKKRKKIHTKLHWCQLIWGFQLHVQFLMWGCPRTPTHAFKLVWSHWSDEMR